MRKLLLLLLSTIFVVPSQAVLKEKNLASTLSVLCAELSTAYKEQQAQTERYRAMADKQHEQMVSLMQKSDQIALMLYSQKQDFTFDMTYVCHEATDLFKKFSQNRMPYDRMLDRIDMEIERYTALTESLESMPPALNAEKTAPPTPSDSALMAMLEGDSIALATPVAKKEEPTEVETFSLDKKGQAEREACLSYTAEILKNLKKMRAEIIRDNEHYERVSEKLKKVNDYALQRYNNIQQSIFSNGGDNYFSVLSSLPSSIKNAKKDISDKYDTEKVSTTEGTAHMVYSQWRGPVVIGLTIFILFYILLATLLSNVVVRWVVPKRFRTESFMKKKECLILAAAMMIFAISIMVAKIFMEQNFFLMASKLLIEFAWLLCVIFISLLVRLSGEQIKSGVRIYLPIMIMSFIVITFRIIFIPNNLVNLIFPPVLLVFTIWQWLVVKRHNDNIPKNDIFYTWVSTLLMIVSTIAAWAGYTLFAVQMLIWWIFQLSCIQTITCAYDLLNIYENKYLLEKISNAKTAAAAKKGYAAKLSPQIKKEGSRRNPIKMPNHAAYINLTWFYDLISMALVPALGVFSVLFSIWWAADVFDLTDAVIKFMMSNFINIPDIVELSLGKLALVVSLFFIFRYLNYLIRSLYQKYRKPKVVVNGTPNFTLSNNIIGICVWGLYCIFALKMLKIPATAISVISAGLATGVGFAMKDLLENFFYGISLMAGRVRVGDYIECDGIRGKVDSITYQSTQLLTGDGCVIAFLNSSLFSKNFKNITKNHSYELVKVPVGVAYGANVDQVRTMLVEAVKGLMGKSKDGRDLIHSKKPISVVFDDFGDNSVNLYVTYWVLVEEKIAVTCRVKEVVYNTLNANNIEIPFPQRDVYIKSVPAEVPPAKKK